MDDYLKASVKGTFNEPKRKKDSKKGRKGGKKEEKKGEMNEGRKERRGEGRDITNQMKLPVAPRNIKWWESILFHIVFQKTGVQDNAPCVKNDLLKKLCNRLEKELENEYIPSYHYKVVCSEKVTPFWKILWIMFQTGDSPMSSIFFPRSTHDLLCPSLALAVPQSHGSLPSWNCRTSEEESPTMEEGSINSVFCSVHGKWGFLTSVWTPAYHKYGTGRSCSLDLHVTIKQTQVPGDHVLY